MYTTKMCLVLAAACLGLALTGCRKEAPAPKASEPDRKATEPKKAEQAAKPKAEPGPSTKLAVSHGEDKPSEPSEPTTQETKKPAAATQKAAAPPKPKRGPMRVGDSSVAAPSPKDDAPAKKAQRARPRGPARVGDSRGIGPAVAAGESRNAPAGNASAAKKDAKRGFPPLNVPDRIFICQECNRQFTMPYREAGKLLGQLRRNAKKGERIAIKCTHCGKKAAVQAHKCKKCGEVMPIPQNTGKGWPDDFVDECPKCGYSQLREIFLRRARRLNEMGRLDLEKAPTLLRKAVEYAKANGDWP